MKENKRKKLNEPTMFTLSVMSTANCAGGGHPFLHFVGCSYIYVTV